MSFSKKQNNVQDVCNITVIKLLLNEGHMAHYLQKDCLCYFVSISEYYLVLLFKSIYKLTAHICKLLIL